VDRRHLSAGLFLAAGVAVLAVGWLDERRISAFVVVGIVFLLLGAGILHRAHRGGGGGR